MIVERFRAEPGVEAVVLSLEESFELDSTALDALVEFDQAVAARGVLLQLARVHDHVRDLLVAAGARGLLSRSSYSVDDAVEAARQALAGRDGPPSAPVAGQSR